MYQCAKNSILPNNINLPVCDIHEVQARDQILNNFHSLANATSSISSRQMEKCLQQNEKIKVLGERILKCKSQIRTLNDLNSAITFVSPCLYPKKYEFNIESNKSHLDDFYQHNKLHKFDLDSQYAIKHDVKKLGEQSKLKIKDLQECANFIFDELRMQPKTILDKGRKNNEQVCNYGKVPAKVQYLDSLSVFSANINPYRKYSIQNNILQLEKRSKLSQANSQSSILKDPLSDFTRNSYISKVNHYVEQKVFVNDIFDQKLNLKNVVDIEEVSDNQSNFQKTKKINIVEDNTGKSGKVPIAEEKLDDFNKSEEELKVPHAERDVSFFTAKDGVQKSPSIYSPLLPEKQKDNQKTSNQLKLDLSSRLIPETLKLPELIINLPPPKLELPIPPKLDLSIPKLDLPLPKLNLPLPKLDLPIPPLQAAPIIPNHSVQIRSGFLEQIENPQIKKRLKPTITKQSGGIKKYEPKDVQKEPEKQCTQGSNDPYDVIAALKKRKQRRYMALHPDEFEQLA